MKLGPLESCQRGVSLTVLVVLLLVTSAHLSRADSANVDWVSSQPRSLSAFVSTSQPKYKLGSDILLLLKETNNSDRGLIFKYSPRVTRLRPRYYVCQQGNEVRPGIPTQSWWYHNERTTRYS